MPAGLMGALLTASAQPFEAGAEGYRAHSGGLDLTLRAGDLQASGNGFAWGLTLGGLGRGGQVALAPQADIVQADGRLEYRRGALTEWYRDTALGLEQGFTVHQSPRGAGPLVLRLDLATDLVSTLDADGRGLSFAAPDGRALRYDHLRAWDADGKPLDAALRYTSGQVAIQVRDWGAAYPITVDPLVYLEQKALVAGKAGACFGYSVAISGDTALVGAPYEDVGSNSSQGLAYVFTRSGTTWSLQQILTTPYAATGDFFGFSVALEGDTALVGAPYDDVGAYEDRGAAYVFTRSGATWTLHNGLYASDGVPDDELGYSVALSSDGNTALVGARYVDIMPNASQGAAYVFIHSEPNWTQQAKLTASDGAAGDRFGTAVAFLGNTALVGAPYDDVGSNSDQGSTYVFTRSETAWTQQAKLTASDGATNDMFGISAALSSGYLTSDTALVGARHDDIGSNSDQGSVYVFTRSGTTWSQQAKLTASDGATDDMFGTSVDLSGDTALVGARYDDVGSNSDQGSAYVFTRSGTTWSQQQQLTAADGAATDMFGVSVALSGDTALVGAWSDDFGSNTSAGSASVFTLSGATWSQQAQLASSEGAVEDRFGWSVALSADGNTALVGARYDDVGSNSDQGSAYVFTRSGTTWSQQQQLTAADGAATDMFGVSVALSGDTALVGAYRADVDSNIDQGSAYVFTRSGTTWSQQAKLIASDGTMSDYFGWSVALSGDGDTALAGAYLGNVDANIDQGSAYIFTRSGTIWTQRAKLTASDGAAADQFGYAVALDDDAALVGVPGDDVDRGAAYVFTGSGATWSQRARLTASDRAVGDAFGWSVALSGNTALVGAYQSDVDSHSNQGSAYVFTGSGATWSQQAKLTASGGAADDEFGWSVALSGDAALVGAHYDDIMFGTDQGSATVFTRDGTTWTQQARLTASDGANGDEFGFSVALSGNTALVGVPHDDISTYSDQGAVYFYDALPIVNSITRADPNPTENASVRFSVTFSEDVTGVGVSDFSLTTTGSLSGSSVAGVAGSGSTFTVTVSTGTGLGTLRLDVPATAAIADSSGNALSNLPYTSGEAYDVDRTGPTVVSITRADPNPTNASNVRFTVTFSEDVFGVESSDFRATTSGFIIGASVTGVSGSGAVYTVTASTGAGSGTLRLDIPVTATIIDSDSHSLYYLPYTGGETYTVDKAAPTVVSITCADPNPTGASSVRFTVTFSEDVTGVSASDFSLTTTGSLSGVSVTNVSGSGATRTVTVSTGTGNGTLRLDIPNTATIADAAGNALTGLPYQSGQAYTILYRVYLPLVMRNY
jgi:hypothetical protein